MILSLVATKFWAGFSYWAMWVLDELCRFLNHGIVTFRAGFVCFRYRYDILGGKNVIIILWAFSCVFPAYLFEVLVWMLCLLVWRYQLVVALQNVQFSFNKGNTNRLFLWTVLFDICIDCMYCLFCLIFMFGRILGFTNQMWRILKCVFYEQVW